MNKTLLGIPSFVFFFSVLFLFCITPLKICILRVRLPSDLQHDRRRIFGISGYGTANIQ